MMNVVEVGIVGKEDLRRQNGDRHREEASMTKA